MFNSAAHKPPIVAAAALALCAGTLAAAVPLPPPQHWTRQGATELLGYIEHIDSHGLDPADYQRDALSWSIQYGDPAQLESQASESFGLVARDLANGHVRPAARGRFYIATSPIQPSQIAVLIDLALTSNDIDKVLDGLAPSHPQYAALRAALTKLAPQDLTDRRKIEASLERWRWVPHNLGDSYLLVNIPEYRVHLVQGGEETEAHRVIVGQPGKPTPQFSATVVGVIVNPTWEVPASIIAESVGKLVRTRPQVARARGYSWSSAGGGLRVSQAPGPQNSLGQMKLDMPNDYRVYLHDTPSKELFDKPERTFSHGCIRTDKIQDLAATLLAPLGWTRARIDDVTATRKTQQVALPKPMPVYVLYFTAYTEADGTVKYHSDPYNLDGAIYDSIHRG